MIVVSQNQSFFRFAYPFVFAPQQFAEIIEKTHGAKFDIDDEKSFPVWQSASFPREDLMRHVSLYLNPPDENAYPTARVWDLTSEALTSFHGLGSRADWKLHAKQATENADDGFIEIPFSFDKIQLTLFRTGVGFLTIQASPHSNQLDDWLNFVHFFRFVNRKNVWLTASRSIGFDLQTRQKSFEPFFPFRPAEENKNGKFNEIICRLLEQVGAVCEDVFIPEQLMPYAVLFVEPQSPTEDFNLIYRLRNFFHSEQGKNPSPDDLKSEHPSLIAYGERQWQIFTLDGGAFLACDAPNTEFFRVSLPDHLRSQYFLLFLLALQQRFALINFSTRISESWFGQTVEHRMSEFEKIIDDFFNFSARGYFVQAMQREHHHRAYRRWQEILQIDAFYQDIRRKIREMHEHLQMRRTEQIKNLTEKNTELIAARERQITLLSVLLALLFGFPSLIIGFLGINLNLITIKEKDGGLDLSQAVLIAGFPLLLGIILSVIFYRRYSKDKDC